ncbi:MAG TPA: glutamyl-tRNA reductase [Candidatus Dormibacteraeota bacterium]
MELIACGLTFHSAPLAVREQAAVPNGQARTTLRFLVGHSGLREAAVLSTCNRTEFYLTAPTEGLAREVAERLARYLDPLGNHGVADHLVARTGADAVHHMFRVAGGLDSMVVGEAQILGQFKQAHRIAREAGTLEGALDFVMKRATSVGKRVRTETGIGQGVASIGELAVSWARQTLGDVAGRSVMLIGAGEVTAVIARRLAGQGARLFIASRGGVSAEALAGEVGTAAVAVARVDDVVTDLDLVISSTDSATPVLTTRDVKRLMARRRQRPLAILDIAVPRDVEPAAGQVDGVVLTDLDALGAVMERNLAGRRQQLPAAEQIISAEVGPTVAVLQERDATGPTIRALVERAEAIRSAELKRSRGLSALDAAALEQVDALTRSLVRKLLHAPIAHLKEQAGDPQTALLLRDAFDLDEAPPSSSGR